MVRSSGFRSAARAPAEIDSQPSTGQVAVRNERTTRLPTPPAVLRPHSAGVVWASTSSQVSPEVPMITRGRAPPSSAVVAVVWAGWADAGVTPSARSAARPVSMASAIATIRRVAAPAAGERTAFRGTVPG